MRKGSKAVSLLQEYRKFNSTFEEIKQLVEEGAEIDYFDEECAPEDRHTILYEACMNDDVNMCEFLLLNGANPNKAIDYQNCDVLENDLIFNYKVIKVVLNSSADVFMLFFRRNC
jgi:ankyrin repeat protein